MRLLLPPTFTIPFLVGCVLTAGGFPLRGEEVSAQRGLAAHLSSPQLQQSTDQFQRKVLPILQQYCLHCHTTDSPEGNVALDHDPSSEAMFAHVHTWLKMAKSQQDRIMPPAEEDQPTDDERNVLIAWAETLGDRLDHLPASDPGPMVFRRLNRRQYNNSMRDLLGVDFDVATAVGLPDDPTAFGFDSIGTALEIPPLLMEKYLAAADEMLSRAVDTRPPALTFDMAEVKFTQSGEMPKGPGKDGPLPPATEVAGGYRLFRLNSQHHFPLKLAKSGTYRLELATWGHKGPAWINWQPNLAIGVNGQVRKSISVLGVRDAPSVEAIYLSLPAGEVDLSVEFVNAEIGPGWAENDDRFRHLGWKSLVVTGPVSSQGIQPDLNAHAGIFFVQPSDQLPPREAARQIVSRFAERAFRRPVESDEIERLLAIYDLAASEGSTFEGSVRYALKAVLVSPHFLFRIEAGSPGDLPGRISDYELATRLSYFLWGTMPDEALRQLAAENRLHDPIILKEQIARLLADDKANGFIHDFARQWLRLDELEHALPSEEFFPEFTATTRHAMRTEVMMFMEHLVHENRSVIELLDADYSFTNRELTAIYHYGGWQDEFQRAEIHADRNPERGADC